MLGFLYTNGSFNLGHTTRPSNIQQQKKKKKKKKEKIKSKKKKRELDELQTFLLSKIERKRTENKYVDLARELKKISNKLVSVILIITEALDTVNKGLVQGLEDLEIWGRVKTIQATALLRSARILRRVLETWRDFLSLQ